MVTDLSLVRPYLNLWTCYMAVATPGVDPGLLLHQNYAPTPQHGYFCYVCVALLAVLTKAPQMTVLAPAPTPQGSPLPPCGQRIPPPSESSEDETPGGPLEEILLKNYTTPVATTSSSTSPHPPWIWKSANPVLNEILSVHLSLLLTACIPHHLYSQCLCQNS
jgi:hypothetical protein